MTFTIREFGLDDLDLVLPAFLEMERHYEGDKAVNEVTARVRVASALSRKHDNIYLGAFAPEMIGFAMTGELFPGPDLRSLWFLKDLFVSEKARGQRIGEKLLRATAQQVMAKGGVRLVFMTDPANLGAQKFYERLGSFKPPVLMRDFKGEALEAFAREA